MGDRYNIVIAYRGTVPTSLTSLKQALQIYLDNSLSIFRNAENFYFKVLEDFGDDTPDKEADEESEKLHKSTLVFTGHSLGGVLADFSAGILERHTSITFDNPGSKPCIAKWCKEMGFTDWKTKQYFNRILGHAYQSNINLVNTCNEQVGETYRLNLPYNIYGAKPEPLLPANILPLYDLNAHYIMGYSLLDQHKITKICNYLKEGKGVTKANYPNNLQAGYAAYLDYDSRSDYWSKYIEACWDLYPEQRIWYENSFEKFSKDAIQKIKLTHDAAVSAIPKIPSLYLDTKILNSAISPPENIKDQQPTVSNLGLFTNNNNEFNKNLMNNEIDIKDFVMIEKNEKVSQGEELKRAKPCLIL